MKDLRLIANNALSWGKRIAKKFDFDEDLCGLCGVCSAHILLILQKEGYNGIIAVSEGHCFNICNDKMIDITAIQFDPKLPQVICRNKNKIPIPRMARDSWDVIETFNELNGFFQWQEKWAEEQKAVNYIEYLGEPAINVKLKEF